MKTPIISLLAISTLSVVGCVSNYVTPPRPELKPPLTADEKKGLTICKDDVSKFMTRSNTLDPFYRDLEEGELMMNCLEAQGITGKRRSDILISTE